MKKQELKIAKGQSLFVDQKTGARTLAIPFKLPDGEEAVLMLTRIKDKNWFPEKEIKNIIINYEDKTIGK